MEPDIFIEARRTMVRAAKEQSTGGYSERVRFNNDSIPNYLTHLRTLEEQAKDIHFIAR